MCHKQRLIYDYIKFGQLPVMECVYNEQCLNCLRTALYYVNDGELDGGNETKTSG